MFSTIPLTDPIGSISELRDWLSKQAKQLASNREAPPDKFHTHVAWPGCVLEFIPKETQVNKDGKVIMDPANQMPVFKDGERTISHFLVSMCGPIPLKGDTEKERGRFLLPIPAGTLILVKDLEAAA